MKRIATTMKMMFKLFHTQKPKLSGDILCTVVLLCWHYFILSFLHNTCLENYAIVYTKATNLEQNNSLLMVVSDSKKKYSSRQKADYIKRLKSTIYFRELWNIEKKIRVLNENVESIFLFESESGIADEITRRDIYKKWAFSWLIDLLKNLGGRSQRFTDQDWKVPINSLWESICDKYHVDR